MAGLLDYGGSKNGILGGYQQQTPDWAQKLGLFSAAIKDAANSFSGQGDTNSLATWQQGQQQSQIRQQLMGALSSTDPAVRQQGYQAITMLGGDPSAFQKQQATQQLPQLLQSMRPSQQMLNSTSAPLPGGGNVTAAPINFEAPGLNISDAISQAPPELQSMYAPKLLDQQITAEAEANKPFDLSPGQVRFAGGQQVASLPQKNNPNEPFNADGTPNLAFQKYTRGMKAYESSLSQDNKTPLTSPTTVEAADPRNPGQRTQFLAQQDKKSGQWYTGDQTRVPLTDVMLPGGVPGGGRAAAQVGRMIGAAKDVSTGLQNVSALPISASTGWMGLLGGKQEAHSMWDASKTVLANQMTPQEVQSTKAMYVGIAKAIGTLDAGGLQTSDTFLKQIGGLLPAEGDTHMTKMLKLAELRQQADNALDAQLNGPLLSSQQKVYAKGLRDQLAKTIPWSPLDVIKLDKSSDPNATISSVAKSQGLGGQSAPANSGGWSNFKVHN